MNSQCPTLRSVAAPKPTRTAGQGCARASKAETKHKTVNQDDASLASGSQTHGALRQLAKLLGREMARESSCEEGHND